MIFLVIWERGVVYTCLAWLRLGSLDKGVSRRERIEEMIHVNIIQGLRCVITMQDLRDYGRDDEPGLSDGYMSFSLISRPWIQSIPQSH